jgi:hypothetical protein
LKRIKRLATEGLAMTAVVGAGLLVFSVAANSGLATRLSSVPFLGTGIKGFRAATNAIVTPPSSL